MSRRKKGPFTCSQCGRDFSRKYAMTRHIVNIHNNKKIPSNQISNDKSGKKANIKCPHCSFCCVFTAEINCHLQTEHKIELNETRLSFPSEDDFERWKENMEIETRSTFVRRSKRTKSAVEKETNFRIYYKCNRSGVFTSDGTGKRSRRARGSCRTGNYCPANIKCHVINGKVDVSFCNVHTGHSHELCHLKLPKSVEDLIVKKIQAGMSFDRILNEIRDEAACSEILEKKHLINRKTLYNLVTKYDLSDVKYHDEDMTKVDRLCGELKETDFNPIRMYKKSGESYANLCIDDTILIIMTLEQQKMLDKFGNDKICVDSTHNSDKYKLQLVSIFIVDEFGVSFPACYCMCSKVDENTMTVLFQEIKKIIGVIETKIFMSEDDPCYYNSWKSVMTEVKSHIVCKWYIDRTWRKNLDKIPDKEARTQVYSALRALLEERNKPKFYSLVRALLKMLNDRGYQDFMQFFISIYTSRPQVWAACYREEACINTSAALEASHKTLKHLYYKSCQENRLEDVIKILLKTIRDKTFDRKVNLDGGHTNTYLEDILIRHQRVPHIRGIAQTNEKQWLIATDSKNIRHTVNKISNQCSCEKKCTLCQVCVHIYSCTCDDYFICSNLCKHIHAVVKFLESNSLVSSSETEAAVDNIVDEIQEDVAYEMDDEPVTCSEKNLFTNQLIQINHLWSNGNRPEINHSDGIGRLCQLANEMIDILSNGKNSQANNVLPSHSGQISFSAEKFEAKLNSRSRSKKAEPRRYLEKITLNENTTFECFNMSGDYNFHI